MPQPGNISDSLVGVTDPKERARIKAQGLVAHVEWAAKRLPYSWITTNGAVVTVTELAYENQCFKVVVYATRLAPVYDDNGVQTGTIQQQVPIDNPIYFYNPPILRGEDRVEDPLNVAKTIIEQAIGVS